MKKSILFILLTCFAFITHAQVPDDALRNAWFIPGGTARNISIGGAMASLGGDITSNNINPAGIGLYKTRELVLTPGVMLNNNEFDYRGDKSSNTKTAFAYGATGFILGTPKPEGYNWTSTAFSVSVNQLASFNNHTYYKGLNNVSSFSEQYLEELTRDGADTNAALSNYIFGSSLAFRTYLVDALLSNNQLIGYKTLVPISTGVIQERDENSTGGYHEISIAFAGNLADQLYLGGSFNIPVVTYKRDLWYKETDATSQPDNNFDFFQFNEHFSSSGVGVNIKLGMIYRAQNGARFGLAIHSPSFIGFKDQVRADMTTNTENYAGLLSENSDNLNSGNPGERTYNLLTPWRFIASGSYLFNPVENTKLQKGFITADIEYVGYGGARFYSTDNQDQTGKDYYNSLNSIVKDYYKAAFNFRVGGEIKFDPVAVRLGGAYYGSPYSNTALKAHRIMASGGLGYRRHGYFVDLGYAYSFNKDVSFPYRLNDKPNTYADWNNKRGNVVVTVGFKL